MGDRYNPLGVTSLITPRTPTLIRPSIGGMTEYEQNLQPVYSELMEEEQKRRRWLKPVQWVFDRLQTGQYMSANLANEIIDAFDGDEETKPQFLKALWEGLTGETKGTYETILRDRLGVGQTKLFPNAPEEKRRSQIDWATILGFIGDVALDPMTYVGFGGLGNVAKTGKKAAAEFAEDATRIMLRTLSDQPQMAQRILGKGAQETVEKALSATSSRGIQTLMRGGGDFGHFVGKAYNKAYKSALSRTQDELLGFITKVGTELPEDIAGKVGTRAAYQGAGTRWGARILGKEKMLHPTGGVKRALGNRTWDQFARLFSGADPGTSKLSNAVWGAFNRGPLGEMRRALGFRNPYEKFLRTKQLEEGMTLGTEAITRATKQVGDAIGELNEKQLDEVWDVFAARETREQVNKQIAAEMPADIAGGQRPLLEAFPQRKAEAAAIVSADPQVQAAVDKLKTTLDGWWAEETRWAGIMGEQAADYRKWYLPEYFRYTDGGTAGKSSAARQFTMDESMQREIGLLQTVWNVDADTAGEMVRKGLSGFSTDPRTNMLNRALVHGRAQARVNMVEQFREFGIDVRRAVTDEGTDLVADGLNNLYISGRNVNELGLRSVKHPAFTGYLFDYDVADIIDRTLDVTGQRSNVFKRGMKAYATWWKSIVTMTTGFHARNFWSNTLTQFLRHGSRAFDKDTAMMAVAAVANTLRESSRKAFLGQLGMTPEWMEKYLNRRIGNFTVRELAERASREGVISRATMGFDPEDIVSRLTEPKGGALWRGEAVRPGKGLLWGKEKLRGTSRHIGEYVENIPRMQSFLIDYGDMAVDPKTLNLEGLAGEAYDVALKQADEATLKWSSREAKKWFIDYTNLTDFEQTTMKAVIPFYSWLRNNLANQISGVLLYPDLYSIIPKIEDVIQYEDPNYDPALVPEWLREAGAVPIGKTDEDAMRFFRPDLAHMDLNLIPLAWEEGNPWPKWTGTQLRDELVNSAAPWLRRAAGWLIQTENPYHFFYKTEMEPTADAPYTMRLFASRPGAMVVLDGLMRMAGFKNGAGMDEEDGKLQIDSRLKMILDEFVPVIRQLDFAFYLPQTIGTFQGEGAIEQFIEEFTGAQDDYEGSEQFFQMLSYYLGIKSKDVDLEAEKMRLGKDIYYQATDLYNELRRSVDPMSEQRSFDARQRREESIRRLGG